MEDRGFWRLEGASDVGLQRDLMQLLASGYRTEARIVAHIAEVDRRSLFSREGFSSLHKYCKVQLGLSENESFHRMTAAAIARKYPIAFALLEQRKIHLSGLCKLRDFLTRANHRELLGEACGKTKQQIEELLAVRFPGRKVRDSMRRLPRGRIAAAAAPPVHADADALGNANANALGNANANALGNANANALGNANANALGNANANALGNANANAFGNAIHGGAEPNLPRASPGGQLSRGARLERPAFGVTRPFANPLEVFDPITSEEKTLVSDGSREGTVGALRFEPVEPSPLRNARDDGNTRNADSVEEPALRQARYRIRFDASSALKAKIDLARALSSHANPSGDLGTLFERAIDLYVEHLQKKRFGKTDKPRPATNATGKTDATNATGKTNVTERTEKTNVTERTEKTTERAMSLRGASRASEHGPATDLETTVEISKQKRAHIPHDARREVVARDGLRCAFVSPSGRRCDEQAFLQIHHEAPWARTKDDRPENLRIYCAGHNRLRAEQDFGESYVARCIEQSRKARDHHAGDLDDERTPAAKEPVGR